MRIGRPSRFFLAMAILALVCAQPVMAQTGKLKVRVTPRETYIYADGKPVVEARGHTVTLSAGEHKIGLYNYGYKPESRSVTIQAHKTTTIDVTMQAVPGTVSGPWGCITLEGAPRAAVLLNGTEPEVFFVGHGDEFDNEWVWKQELLVPPGKHELVVQARDRDPWTTTVDVQANQRVVVDAYKGVRKTVPWKRGEKMQSLPRFKAGMSSATVAVQKVTGQFSASPGQVKCGESAHLAWSSEGAGKTDLNGSAVAASGDQTIQPKQTTTYDFTAAGPGGVVKQSATVNVDSAIQASLSISPGEVRYHKVGDKVVEQGSATMSWSTTNAQVVSIDPLGTVEASGSKTLTPTPKKTDYGPVDETDTYTLHATNECGGSQTETATLHIVGLIEREHVEVTLSSIFFPTAWPDKRHAQDGLLSSQKAALDKLADTFVRHHEAQPESRLLLEAHADRRGSRGYNMQLSERRANIVKDYLVSKGVSADLIEIKAFGWTQNLSLAEVKKLESDNPSKPAQIRNWVTDRLAHNRRVDPVLEPDNLRPTPYYPHDASDSKILQMRGKPSLRTVRKSQ